MKRSVSRSLGAAMFAAVLVAAAVVRAAAPAGRYTISSGTVFDTKTKLTWQQAVSSSTYTQAAAAAYCMNLSLNGTGWRLPTMKELVTIVDYTVAFPGPTVDPTYFPSAPAESFWSSTPNAGTSGYAWGVNFGSGNTDVGALTDSNDVRCVR